MYLIVSAGKLYHYSLNWGNLSVWKLLQRGDFSVWDILGQVPFFFINLQVLVKDRGRTLQNLYMNCRLKKNDEQGREILSLEPQHKNDLES